MNQVLKSNKVWKTIGITTATLAISAATVLGVVSAQEPTEDGQGRSDRRGPRGNSEIHALLHSEDVRAQMQTALAQALNLSVAELEAAKESGQSLRDLATEQGVEIETLKAAKDEVLSAVLAEAVENEIITQEQADRIAERGARGFGRHGGKHGGRGFSNIISRDEVKAAIADALGLEVGDLEVARENGQTLEELAAEQGVEMSEIEAAKKAVIEAAIADAVADGTITQEQADRMLERLENGGPRGGRDGNFGGRRGPRGGNGPAPEGQSL